MAISSVYTTGAAGGSAAGANFTLTPPTSAAAVGDVMIVIIGERTTTQTVTKVADTATGTKTFTSLRFFSGSSTCSVSSWYRVLQSGDPGVGNTNTLTVTNTGNVEALLACYTGVDTTTPIDAQGTTNTGTASTSTFNSVTTVTAGAMFIGALAAHLAATPLNSQTSGTPTLTARIQGNNGGNNTSKQSAAILDGIISAAGATGSFGWSNNTAAAQWTTDTFALRPASAAAPILKVYNYSVAIPRSANY